MLEEDPVHIKGIGLIGFDQPLEVDHFPVRSFVKNPFGEFLLEAGAFLKKGNGVELTPMNGAEFNPVCPVDPLGKTDCPPLGNDAGSSLTRFGRDIVPSLFLVSPVVFDGGAFRENSG
jgi:hypothetical protein